MEKIVKESTQSYKHTYYIATDGKEFSDAESCERYEDYQKIGNIEYKEVDFNPFFEKFYFAKDEQTLSFLIKYYFDRDDETLCGTKLKVGDWITSTWEYNNNGPDKCYITTLEEIKETIFSVFGDKQ